MRVIAALPDPSAPLSRDAAAAAFAAILDGEVADAEIAAFLVNLSERGESAIEIAAAARALRARMLPIAAPAGAIDVCGTGGDGHHTLNVSTAVAIVVAAAGVPVAKHGNRAASSMAGAADTLEALGLDLDRASRSAERTLAEIGIGFLFAAHHHPALRRLAPIRRAIGRRTIFNLMGPLANPASVTRQLIGIARPDYVPVYADALATLGAEAAAIVARTRWTSCRPPARASRSMSAPPGCPSGSHPKMPACPAIRSARCVAAMLRTMRRRCGRCCRAKPVPIATR